MSETNDRTVARPIFRKLAWIPAGVSFFMTLVAVTGFLGADNRLWATLLFLFTGLVFMTIALMGGMSGGIPAAGTNLVMGMFCLLILLSGLDEVMNPNFVKRFLGGLMVISGSVGVIANLMAYRQQRNQDKQQEK